MSLSMSTLLPETKSIASVIEPAAAVFSRSTSQPDKNGCPTGSLSVDEASSAIRVSIAEMVSSRREPYSVPLPVFLI